MHKSALLFSSLWFITTVALAAPSQDDEVLAEAYRQQMLYRAGHPEVAQPLVKTLEAAVSKSKDNARLWEALGHAYMSLQGSLYAGTPDMPKLIETAEHARAAYARSLALQAANPLARAALGMSTLVASQLKGDGPGVMAGIAEMNAAVRVAPTMTGVRLTRGFTIVHLPPGMRDNDAVIEDFRFIMNAAPGGRPEDVVHVLLGDVYAETGDLPSARQEYAQVTGASAFAAEQVKLRLADLAKGAISPESITAVRAGTGTCVMCHAPGTDN